MNIKEAEGKNVKILLSNGQAFLGFAYDYTSELDNEPDPASITIGDVEIFEPEISSITELK